MPVSIQALTDALGRSVGTDRLVTDPLVCARFAVDGLVPAWVARPAGVDAVSRVLRLAAEERLAVIPRGRGTLMDLGNPPRRVDGVLDLSDLSALVAHEPADLTVSVQCGISLSALGDQLAKHRQFLPLDPFPGMSRSVGGVLATAASGPLRFRYGTPRDLLLGIRFVQPDGTITWGGAKVVKSVTGYDIPKLMVGSLGTLGALVEATLRLHPLPEAEATWVVSFPAAEHAAGLLAAILDSPLEPSRLEILSSGAGGRVAVSFGSAPEAVSAQGERLRELGQRAGGAFARAEPHLWSGLWGLLSEAPVLLKIATLPSQTAALCGEVQRLATGLGLHATLVGEAGNGVLRAALRGTLAAAEWEARVVAPLRERLAPAGGGVVVERAPGELKERLDVWGPVEPAALAIMKQFKSEFDPLGILNPGRFVGGI